MAPIGSIGGIQSPLLQRLPGITRADGPEAPVRLPGATQAQPAGFGKVFEQLVSSVDAKQNEAQAITQDVLLGKNENIHQSMIAMQEAGVAFQMMVEVRNKVVESYQELMRMPV